MSHSSDSALVRCRPPYTVAHEIGFSDERASGARRDSTHRRDSILKLKPRRRHALGSLQWLAVEGRRVAPDAVQMQRPLDGDTKSPPPDTGLNDGRNGTTSRNSHHGHSHVFHKGGKAHDHFEWPRPRVCRHGFKMHVHRRGRQRSRFSFRAPPTRTPRRAGSATRCRRGIAMSPPAHHLEKRVS